MDVLSKAVLQELPSKEHAGKLIIELVRLIFTDP